MSELNLCSPIYEHSYYSLLTRKNSNDIRYPILKLPNKSITYLIQQISNIILYIIEVLIKNSWGITFQFINNQFDILFLSSMITSWYVLSILHENYFRKTNKLDLYWNLFISFYFYSSILNQPLRKYTHGKSLFLSLR